MNLLLLSFSPPPQQPPRCVLQVQTGSESEIYNAVKLLDGEIFQGIGGTLCKIIVPDRVTLAVPDIVPKIVPIIYPSAKVAKLIGHTYVYYSDNCSNYGGQCLFILYVRRLYDMKCHNVCTINMNNVVTNRRGQREVLNFGPVPVLPRLRSG